jgi:hypothetical protein
MSFAALIAWVLTALLGLYMFTTWLIEDDGSTDQPSYRLRAPVVFTHAGLALTGLSVWLLYVYVDSHRLAWAALLILVAVAALGLIMFTRWVPVHRQDSERAGRPSHRAGAATVARPVGARVRDGWVPDGQVPDGQAQDSLAASRPAERSFPLVVVVLHGVCAAITVGLVLLVTLGVVG